MSPPILRRSDVDLNVPNSAGFSIDEVTARYIGDKLSLAFGKDKKSAIQIYVRLNPELNGSY